MPDKLDYDAAKRRLIVGEGYVDNVPISVWQYDFSGKQVLVQWFSYRRRDRSRPINGADEFAGSIIAESYARDNIENCQSNGHVDHFE